MTNITLAIDEDVLAKGKEFARRRDMSFNSFVRKLVEDAMYPADDGSWIEGMIALAKELNGNSGGQKWSREDLYER